MIIEWIPGLIFGEVSFTAPGNSKEHYYACIIQVRIIISFLIITHSNQRDLISVLGT